MGRAKKKDSDINPEIRYEQEQERSRYFYDDYDEIRLFPGFLDGSTVSSTECTGLIQVAPVTPEILAAYQSVYDYRQRDATLSDEE